ncbi:hypothetical protein DYB28_011500, partial [Aphanomyces astaci]
MFRGAKGVLVALDVEKGSAEVLLQKNTAAGASTELSLSTFNRPIRVPLEDIAALPDVECKGGDLSRAFLKHLVESNLPHFLTSVLTDPINLSQDQPNENRDHLMGLLLGLVGFRALGSLVQSGDENDLVLRDCIPLLFQVATIHTQNPSDISLLEEHWVQRYKLWYDVQCPSGVDALDDASAPPSALCQQMMEMGFPREWCDVALLKCSYQVEAAINFCFEHSSDMDRLVKQPTARSTGRTTSPPTSSRSTRPDVSPILLEQLSEMGFPITWCRKAL